MKRFSQLLCSRVLFNDCDLKMARFFLISLSLVIGCNGVLNKVCEIDRLEHTDLNAIRVFILEQLIV